MKVFFVDTNLFLQCKELSELDWSKLTNGDEFLLLISRAVQKEIDKHKKDGNSRRSKRARKATSLFKKILKQEDLKIIICEKKPRVEISFSGIVNYKEQQSEELNLDEPDDCIINEALIYREKNLKTNTLILTHDTNLMLTAKNCNVDYLDIPAEWLLEPEKDERDTKIKKLEETVNTLEKQQPKVTLVNTNLEENEELILNIVEYDNLSDEKVSIFVDEVRKKHPAVSEFKDPAKNLMLRHSIIINRATGKRYKPPSEEKIKKYKDEEYPSWIESVERFFKYLPKKLESPQKVVSLEYRLDNNGVVPAKNLIIEFNAVSDLSFKDRPLDSTKDKKLEISLPSPPLPPEGSWINSFDSHFPTIGIPPGDFLNKFPFSPSIPLKDKPRDLNSFYYKKETKTQLSFDCKEFRHRADSEYFNLKLLLPERHNNKNSLIFKVLCRITSTNMPEPVKLTTRINVTYRKGDINEKAQQFLDDFDRGN